MLRAQKGRVWNGNVLKPASLPKVYEALLIPLVFLISSCLSIIAGIPLEGLGTLFERRGWFLERLVSCHRDSRVALNLCC